MRCAQRTSALQSQSLYRDPFHSLLSYTMSSSSPGHTALHPCGARPGRQQWHRRADLDTRSDVSGWDAMAVPDF